MPGLCNRRAIDAGGSGPASHIRINSQNDR
jgi:hypothetical protein